MPNYWHEIDLSEWAKQQKQGDKYLPYQQWLRILKATDFIYPEKEYNGRGIVIAAGGRLLPGAWVTVRLLRDFGCKLPVEIWHLGKEEIEGSWKEILAPYDVTFRDAFETREKHPCHRLSGWQLKPYSIIFSRFEEVLFIDADNHPTKNPEYLRELSAMLWPDRVCIMPDSSLWEIFELPATTAPVHETGQALFNKRNCWKALQMAMHCNQHSDFYYKHSHGDTALYEMAFRGTDTPYHLISHRLIEVPVDREVEDIETLKSTAYMRQPGDIRALFLNRGPDGDIIFQHRTGGGGAQVAFGLGENKHLQHFQHEDRCFELVEELRKKFGMGAFWIEQETTQAEKISPHRRNGFAALFRLMDARHPKIIVETGTLRQENNWHNDGGFTWHAASWAQRRGDGAKVYTIDIDPQAIDLCRKITEPLATHINYIISDSLAAIPTFSRIDVLYLDSLDYHEGQEETSQLHVLREIMKAMQHLHKDSIIAIDDCKLPGGGKAGAGIPFLKANGWEVVHDDYVSVLIKRG